MTNLDPDICFRLRDARREAGLSQSALAAEIGCKQSALSMFEQGDGTKLNDEAIRRYAERFGIEIETVAAAGADPRHIVPGRRPGQAFCPNPHCPGTKISSVGGRRLGTPDRAAQDPAGGRFCALCGEVLETACPSCAAPVHAGAVCTFCGAPYVALPQG